MLRNGFWSEGAPMVEISRNHSDPFSIDLIYCLCEIQGIILEKMAIFMAPLAYESYKLII